MTSKLTQTLARLEELAKAATAGQWCVEDPLDNTLSIVEAGKQTYEWRFIANCSMPDEDNHEFTSREVKANAAFIAANSPAEILDLIAQVRAELREAALTPKEG